MHLVIMAWLFVIGTMSLTGTSLPGGIAFFALAGIAPVALYAWLKLRRLGARRRTQASLPEQRVDDGDHGDAGGDQR
ncbi:MAG TPA: hypothetical protein VFQ55_18625 [Casimicrobiaceae bacterium]|jgi:hypothetical protein|nr:hypothetical protein [Casimicrobiaceae bacterium]